MLLTNSNIKVEHISQKGLHLNPKGKGRLNFNFMRKIRGPWWSPEHLNVPSKPYISPSNSLKWIGQNI